VSGERLGSRPSRGYLEGVVRADDGVLRLRLEPGEARARVVRAFDADASARICLSNDGFSLRDHEPPSVVSYVLYGRISDDTHGTQIALERRLRGGAIGIALLITLGIACSVGLFAWMLCIGRGGITEWLGLLFLPWVLLTLGQALHSQLAVARAELDTLRERLADVFADVLVRAEDGPYR
jgi:hypothetical protein